MSQIYKPESYYTVDPHMSLEQVMRAQENSDFIVGKVTIWEKAQKKFHIDLGNNITAVMPWAEASIYPVTYRDGILNAEGYTLVGSIVCLRVLAVSEDTIIVSRKENMKKAFEALSSLEGETVEASVKTFSKIACYLDIGHGISGMLHVRNFCKSRLENIRDLQIPQKLSVKITDVDSEKFRVDLSYKDLFEDLSGSFEEGDLIEALILQQMNYDGWFAYLNPNTTCVVNSQEVELNYGDRVVARVVRPQEGRLKLTFVSFKN